MNEGFRDLFSRKSVFVYKVTDDWNMWSDIATEIASRFRVAVDANQRDDEFAASWDMMEFLQETVAALKSNGSLDYDGLDKEERALRVLQSEAWEYGYAAAVKDLEGFDADGSTTPNPFVIWTDRD